MNDKLRTLLMSVFNLTEAEFSESLVREDVSSWDSLRHMDLITSIEREFNIMLEMQDILDMESFPLIIETLTKKGVNLEG